MNPRVAKLVTAAHAVRRRIWASLPFRVRVAELFIRLAEGTADAFGLGVYDIFKKQGVEGLPTTPSEFRHEAKQFGGLAYKTLLAKWGRQFGSDIEDIMMDFMLRLHKGGASNIKPGTTLNHARGIVMMGLDNQAKNHRKYRQRRPSESLTHRDEGGGEVVVDPGDPNALKKLEREVGEHELLTKLEHMKHDLEKAHPDALLYLQLVIKDGLNDKEIIGDSREGLPSMLPHPYTTKGHKPLTPQNWLFVKKEIMQVLKDKLGDTMDDSL